MERVVVVPMAEMVDELSRHRPGIPKQSDGVLEHLLVDIERRTM